MTNLQHEQPQQQQTSSPGKWAKHSLSFPKTELTTPTKPLVRKSRASRFQSQPQTKSDNDVIEITSDPEIQKASTQITNKQILKEQEEPKVATTAPKKKRVLRPRKALITLTSSAVEHLQGLLDQPEPKLIRIGVRNRGCSGLTYNLEYVDKPGKFDELIEQDGVKVLIDSKALFSIVGSEMDWLDDKLSSRFIFKNPNSKGTCGCGESFMV
ncbi:ISA1 Iron-sulfur assembly protein 1 [Candida maltosa Xu316]